MVKYILPLMLVLLIAACSTNQTRSKAAPTTAVTDKSEEIIAQERLTDQETLERFNKNYPQYRESIENAVRELSEIRDRLQSLVDKPDFIYQELEALKNLIPDAKIEEFNNPEMIEYQVKAKELETLLKQIEKQLMEIRTKK